MGSTFSVMGLSLQAFEFWWKALRIRPTFWDALVRYQVQLRLHVFMNPPTGQYARRDPRVEPLEG